MDTPTIEDVNDVELLVNGRRRLSVRLLRVNPPTETTIFLVHGSMASLVQYNRLIEKLKAFSLNIVAYDAYGCGKSDKPHNFASYSTEEHLHDLFAVYDKYSTARNILIGHSFGTSQVARLCKHIKQKNESSLLVQGEGQFIDRPMKSIDAVILLGTAYHVPDGGHPIFNLPLCILNCLSGYLARQFVSMAYSSTTDEAIKHESFAMSRRNDMYVVKAFYKQMKWASKEDWATINKYPVLILHGADDMILPVIGAETLIQELRDMQYEKTSNANDINLHSTARLHHDVKFNLIENCGHQIMMEKPDEVYEIIKQFLVNSNILSDKIVKADIDAYWNNNNADTNNDDIQIEVDASEGAGESESLVIN